MAGGVLSRLAALTCSAHRGGVLFPLFWSAVACVVRDTHLGPRLYGGCLAMAAHSLGKLGWDSPAAIPIRALAIVASLIGFFVPKRRS